MAPRPNAMTQDAFGALLPSFADRVLHVGAAPSGTWRQLYAQRGTVWYLAKVPTGSELPPDSVFDCVVVDIGGGSRERHCEWSRLIPLLGPSGRMIFPGWNPAETMLPEATDELLHRHGLLRFKTFQLPSHAGETQAVGVVAVRRAYNPVSHARSLASEGNYRRAIDVLDDIPLDLLNTDEDLASLSAEKQSLYLIWQQSLPAAQPPHKLYFKARREFAQVTSTLPHHPAAYRHEAAFWSHMGHPEMARRALTSILHVTADPECRSLLEGIPQSPGLSSPIDDAPVWSGSRRAPRVLVITHDRSDYGMDTLYDGLVRVIGGDNIEEYPWKPVLHGQDPDAVHNYPCDFDHRTAPRPLELILADLRCRRFDVIVYADLVQMSRRADVQRIMEAGRDLPLVVYDTWDDAYTPMDILSDYIGGKPVDLLFKREMLLGVDYGANVIPLPFGYPDPRVPLQETARRDLDVFWAGKRVWGMRPIFLPEVERVLGVQFQKSYPQAEYSRRLRGAAIGLSLCGTGFDTVRYWEVPAHGAMLLAERPPLRIPGNFVDGRSAVLFGDLPELLDKLQHYRAHPEEVERIAEAGYRHFLAHHTTSARARQFLGHLERRLQWG